LKISAEDVEKKGSKVAKTVLKKVQ